MKRLLASFAIAAVLATPAFALPSAFDLTPEKVMVDGVQATRIVIAPPLTPLANTIKDGLKQAYENLPANSRAYDDALKLYYFYGARHFEPLWLRQAGSGQLAWSDNAVKIIDAFKKADLSGLRTSDYLTPEIATGPAALDPGASAALETAFSDVALRYAQNLHGGRIDPSAVSDNIFSKPPQINPTDTLIALASSADPAAYLSALEPKYREYAGLKAALAKYLDGSISEPVTIPDGKILYPGMNDPRLPLLRTRLNVSAAADQPDSYDDTTLAAIKKFQSSLGLVVDGVVGPATVAALNGGEATSKGDIIANMERWRWMPEDMGAFHVEVNIPEFRLAVVDNGIETYTTRVVTGKPSNQTPVFSDEIEHIVVNPYWNVPDSIATKEIGPKLSTDPGYISGNNMELLSGGRVIDASAVDWSSTSISNFRIRQRPGANNALGSVKFLFPNTHDIYLHDTPSKSLFNRSYRAFSHGCVRVQNPWDFAGALLSNEPKIKLASLESEIGGSEQWNNLARHIPVHLMYFTLRVDENGAVHSFGDVYGQNKKLKELLGE